MTARVLAALAHAAHDPEWMGLLRGVLRKSVTRDIDKAVISDQSARLPRQRPIERFDLGEAHIEIG